MKSLDELIELSDYLQELFDKYQLSEVEDSIIEYNSWCVSKSEFSDHYRIKILITRDKYHFFSRDLNNIKLSIEKRICAKIKINNHPPESFPPESFKKSNSGYIFIYLEEPKKSWIKRFIDA